MSLDEDAAILLFGPNGARIALIPTDVEINKVKIRVIQMESGK